MLNGLMEGDRLREWIEEWIELKLGMGGFINVIHTTEEWTIRNDANGHWGMREVIGPAVRVVGFTIGIGVSHEHAETVERDIRVIAASKKLLAACIESLARFEQDGWPLNEANTAAIELLREAIGKATSVGVNDSNNRGRE